MIDPSLRRFALVLLLLVAAGPLRAEDPEPENEDEFPFRTFRLYSLRDIDLRARPNVGLRLAPLRPLYSPSTADFYELDRETGPLSSVAISITGLGLDEGERGSVFSHNNAKLQEFRDLEDGLAVGLDAQVRDERNWLRLTGRHLGLDDADTRLEYRRIGVFSSELFVNQIPHNFAFNARSLYSGVGTGELRIDDDVQRGLQGSTDLVDAAARITNVFDAAAAFTDLALERDRVSFEFDLTAFDPLAIEIAIDDESRQGVRPWSASFGLANAVEVPWPVDYDTQNLRATVEWAKDATLVRAQFYHSEFENNISNVLVDNPWRLDDAAGFGAIVSSFQDGASTGLIDLYPSNEQEELTLEFVKHSLPAKGNLLVTYTVGELEQNDPLVPFTTNSAVMPGAAGDPPFDATDPANRPAAFADARFDTELLNVRFTSRPLDHLDVDVHFRSWELDNETEQIFIPGFVPEDTFYRPFTFVGPEGGGYTNLPIAQDTTEAGVKLGVRFAGNSKLTFDVMNKEVDREFREVASSEELRFKVSWDVKPVAWTDLRVSYLTSERDVDDYDALQFFDNQGVDFVSALPFLRKFDQAERDRDRLQIIANLYPSESLVVGAQIIVGEDDYTDSAFGVQNDRHETWAVDVSYLVTERVSLFASYSVERYEVEIAGREWISSGPSNPFGAGSAIDNFSNWFAVTEDEIDGAVFGFDVDFIPGKLHLDFAFSFSESDGLITYTSPLGPADQDLNPYVPVPFTEVDDYEWYSVNPELEWVLNDRLALTFAYLKERFDISDFVVDTFENIPVTDDGEFNGGLFMGTLFGDSKIELLYLRLKVTF